MAEFIMPSLGADMKNGILVDWRVKPGDQVKRGDIIADIETDKGVFEVEVYSDGVIDRLLVEPGEDKIPVGTVLATIASATEQPTFAPAQSTERRIKASPAARKLAAEHQIDLSRVSASGAGGAITLADIETAIKTATQEQINPPSAPPERPKASAEGLRKAIAAAMSLANREIPHYYLATEIDMSRALAWQEEYNRQHPISERLLPVVLLLKATALALTRIPELNAYWVDGKPVIRPEVNIGFAVALRGGGLITPALANVDRLSLAQLMSAMSDLISRTRAGKLRASELTSAGITVTSLGDLGVRSVFGIIYPPQVALVGFGRISERPWAENGAISARPILTATLAADHRASDGHLGARFLDTLDKLLQEPEKL